MSTAYSIPWTQREKAVKHGTTTDALDLRACAQKGAEGEGGTDLLPLAHGRILQSCFGRQQLVLWIGVVELIQSFVVVQVGAVPDHHVATGVREGVNVKEGPLNGAALQVSSRPRLSQLTSGMPRHPRSQQHLAPVDAAVQDEHIVRGLRLLLDERRLSRLAGPIDPMAGLP